MIIMPVATLVTIWMGVFLVISVTIAMLKGSTDGLFYNENMGCIVLTVSLFLTAHSCKFHCLMLPPGD